MTAHSFLPMMPTGGPDDSPANEISESIADLVADPVKMAEIQPQVIATLKTVFDPEIPVDIYELGLIYDVLVDSTSLVGIRMTLTAPACPAAQSLPIEVREKTRTVPGVSDVKVEIVWEPAWTKERMSDVAKLQLGLF